MSIQDMNSRVTALVRDLDSPLTGEQIYHRFTGRLTRRRARRRRLAVASVLAATASLTAVVGGVWAEPTRYASAGTPDPGRGVAAVGVYQGQPWSVSVAIERHCDDRSQDMINFSPAPPPASPNDLPKPPPFRINVRTNYSGHLIGDFCDAYPFLTASWPTRGMDGFLINYGGGQGQTNLSHSNIGVFTGWARPNVAWIRVSFGNGQHLTLKTMSVGHGIALRFFGYVADNRLSVSQLAGYDATGHYLGHARGKN